MKYLPAVIVVVMVVLALVAGLWLRQWLGEQQPQTKKMVQQITVIAPPPPPPPPPEQAPPPEEPEVQEEVIEEQPEAAPNEEPAEAAGEELGVDADGSAGGDGFGLVARKGGRGLLGGGGYEQFVRQEINAWIIEHPRLKHLAYVAVLTLRIEPDGALDVVDLAVTGDAEVQRLLREVLAKNHRLSRPRPLEAASVVKLRVRSVL